MGKMKFRAVSINRLDEGTIDSIRIWRNQDFVRKNMLQQHIITEEEHKAFIDKVKNDSNRGMFVFYLDDKPFGVFQYQIDLERDCVVNGCYLINEEDQYLGYGSIMYYMIGWIQYEQRPAKKVCDKIIENNKNAFRMKKNAGVQPTRCIKSGAIVDGKEYDVYEFEHIIGMPDKNGRLAQVVAQFIDIEPLEDMILF